MSVIEDALVDFWGEPCDDFDPDCPTCQAWKEFEYLMSLSHSVPYRIPQPENGWRSTESFGADEKAKLRPIAETLAMLDGNAFFTVDAGGKEWFEMYLPEAAELYRCNGGDDGWAGEASFAKPPSP